jgi:hypothetical protein
VARRSGPLTALAMRVAIKRLQRQYNVAPVAHAIPLAPAVDYPVIVEGLASTGHLDGDRTKVSPFAFGLLRPVPLLFKHREPAGSVEAISYTADGAVWIKARVTHYGAKMCGAFSIACRVLQYQIVQGPDFHAVITDAELTEVSLTDVPSNIYCTVQNRYPSADFYWLMGQKVDCLQRMATQLKELAA